MKSAIVLSMLTLLLLALPPASSAQLIRSSDIPRTDWAVEASILGHYNEFEFGQINDHIQGRPLEMIETQPNPLLTYQSVTEQEEFGAEVAFDLRLGARYKGFRFGGGYARIPDQTGGFTMVPAAGNPERYEITVKAHEFYAYGGYLHPINDVFEVGVIAAVGLGNIEGEYTDEFGGYEAVSHEGTYTPVRVEARGLIHLTRYVSLDLGVGMRTANSSDVVADFGISGVTGIDGSTGPLIDYQDQPMDFDLSGWYVGGGITLKNPFEQR